MIAQCILSDVCVVSDVCCVIFDEQDVIGVVVDAIVDGAASVGQLCHLCGVVVDDL